LGSNVGKLAIREVAERTGIAAGTIRMWEQRYGFPVPARTASGYRRYSDDDVDSLLKVASFRSMGLSIPAAIDRVRGSGGAAAEPRPSVYAAVAPIDEAARPQVLRKSTLMAISRAIEHEALAHAAAPVLFAAFQQEQAFRAVEHRYQRLARQADAATVFADFPEASSESRPVEIPIDLDDAIGNEWVLVVDAPGYGACLVAWEQPARDGVDELSRRFEAIWTVHPQAVRRAAQVSARIAGSVDAAYGERLEALLAERPLSTEAPAPALTALTQRAIAYVEAASSR
jgi:DICT domain-containing protein/predicted DNA-binding transcriptional regulator AlpA